MESTREVTYTSEEVAAAMQAASVSQWRNYYLEGFPPGDLINLLLVGCNGSQGKVPLEVAESSDAFLEKMGLKLGMIIVLGDNLYPDGAHKPDDPRFQSQFYHVLGNPKLIHIKDVPCVMVLGNHDRGIDKMTDSKNKLNSFSPVKMFTTNPHKGKAAELQQKAHSYLFHPSDPEEFKKLKMTKAEFFQQEHVSYSSLPKHLMPHDHCSWIIDNKLQLFVLNSNTYMSEFVDYLQAFANNKEDEISNQVTVVAKEYFAAIDAKRETIFNMHHPIEDVGKRSLSWNWDAKQYLLPLQITWMDRIMQLSPDDPDRKQKMRAIFLDKTVRKSNGNHSKMLAWAFTFQKIFPMLVNAAHAHATFYINNKINLANKKEQQKQQQINQTMAAGSKPVLTGREVCEIVTGGGGHPDLQEQMNFSKELGGLGEEENSSFDLNSPVIENDLACYLRQHSSCIVSIDRKDPQKFDVYIISAKGTYLHFNSESSRAIHIPSTEPKVEKLREYVLQACDSYRAKLHEQKNQVEKAGYVQYVRVISSHVMHSILSPNNDDTHIFPEVDRMHEMVNFLNQPGPISYESTVIFLDDCMNKIINKNEDPSLYKMINSKLICDPEFGSSINHLRIDLSTSPSPVKK